MTTTATGTIVDQIIEACTIPCRGCNGTGKVPTGPVVHYGGPGRREIPMGGTCDACGGRGRQPNEEGRKLAAFIRVELGP